MDERRRILLVAEAVTLAHVGRLITLARSLDRSRYEIHFACDPRHEKRLSAEGFRFCPIRSVDPEIFLKRLAEGKSVYTEPELIQYVEEEQKLLSRLRPDFVVSDFRLSLAISARRAGVPLINVTNAHWSPRVKGRFPLPENPVFRGLGWSLSSLLFGVVRAVAMPIGLRLHALPMNRVRRRYGLSPLRDIREVYTDGDLKLFADTPGLVPLRELRPDERYLGPLLWSPDCPLPEWWERLDPAVPSIYVTLGSSGNLSVLPAVVEALAEFPVQVLIATAGRLDLRLPPRFFAAEYLPGLEAARRSALVICNGGSGTVYQALSVGVPVLGIVSNLDQAWTMDFVEKAGAGRSIRYWRVRRDRVRRLVAELLSREAYRERAGRVGLDFKDWDAGRIFPEGLANAGAFGKWTCEISSFQPR